MPLYGCRPSIKCQGICCFYCTNSSINLRWGNSSEHKCLFYSRSYLFNIKCFPGYSPPGTSALFHQILFVWLSRKRKEFWKFVVKSFYFEVKHLFIFLYVQGFSVYGGHQQTILKKILKTAVCNCIRCKLFSPSSYDQKFGKAMQKVLK